MRLIILNLYKIILISTILLYNNVDSQKTTKRPTVGSLDDLLGSAFDATDYTSEWPVNQNPKIEQPIPGPTPAVTQPSQPIPVQPVVTSAPPSTFQPTPAPVQPTEPHKPYEPTYQSCGDNKICVPFYNCNNRTGTLNTDGEGLIDIRFDGSCKYAIETCCAIDDKSPGNEGYPTIPDKPDVIPTGQIKCGKRNANGLYFNLIGNPATDAKYGEFPWMIALLSYQKVGDEFLIMYQCGGSLIHPNVVLTGAHCVHKLDPANLVVRAGEWDTQTRHEIHESQDRQVIEVVIHEEFAKTSLHNDIALLFTAQPFEIRTDVQPVCLPPYGTYFDHSRCFVTGWGKSDFGQKFQYSLILKKVDVPVVPNDVCQAKLRDTRLGKFFQLHESFICAGGEVGKDACKGDGGGPLSCPIPGHEDEFYQAGIVAWGIGCNKDYPGVYVNVAHFRKWIDEVMLSRNYDTSSYTAE